MYASYSSITLLMFFTVEYKKVANTMVIIPTRKLWNPADIGKSKSSLVRALIAALATLN